jgi:hypothetical protein
MIIKKLKNMTKGWFIGNFEPSMLKTEIFEVGCLERKKGKDIRHYHKIATEITCLLSGSMIINGTRMEQGDIFILEPYTISESEFYEDSKLVVVKIPSVIGDKYEV